MKTKIRALLPVPASGAALPLPVGGAIRQLTLPLKPVQEFLASFMEGNTSRAYSRDLSDFFGQAPAKVGMPEVLSVVPPDVATFRDGLILRGLKAGTIARKLSALRGLYAYLMARGAAPCNPADEKLVKAPKRPNLMKTDAISWNEALSLIKAPDQSTPGGRRDYTLLMLDVRLGLRRSELVSIRIENIRPGPPAPFIYFKGKREKERRVEIRPELFGLLESYHGDLDRTEGWLFPGNKGSHLSGSQFWRIVKKYAAQVGLSRNIHPHSLRAAFVTFSLEAGVPIPDIQRAVGHTSPETTLGYARDLEQVKSRAPRALDGLHADAEPRVEATDNAKRSMRGFLNT